VKAKESEKQIDYDLMKRIQGGDMVAFNKIVDRYKDRLMNIIVRMLRRPGMN